ncbi:hypothetical protein K439DRAFT_917258 [Ramaria rubella]|nr:hypothetical protein K439DRAFT_917258 [Ramaria rubella]
MASFVWGFNTFNGTSLPECAAAPIFLQTPGATQPPYYFFAHEAAGITTVHSLGSDINNLTWTVDHAAGSQLVLSMADAAGNSGGVAPNLYTVTSSGSTSCHAQNPTSPVSITTNVTKSLQSCEILPIKVSGGTKPYTVTVTALASGAVTNFTLSSQFDTYNWVNRASPNAQLLGTLLPLYHAMTRLINL